METTWIKPNLEILKVNLTMATADDSKSTAVDGGITDDSEVVGVDGGTTDDSKSTAVDGVLTNESETSVIESTDITGEEITEVPIETAALSEESSETSLFGGGRGDDGGGKDGDRGKGDGGRGGNKGDDGGGGKKCNHRRCPDEVCLDDLDS